MKDSRKEKGKNNKRASKKGKFIERLAVLCERRENGRNEERPNLKMYQLSPIACARRRLSSSGSYGFMFSFIFFPLRFFFFIFVCFLSWSSPR